MDDEKTAQEILAAQRKLEERRRQLGILKDDEVSPLLPPPPPPCAFESEVIEHQGKAKRIVLIRTEEEHHAFDVGYLARHFCRCHFPMTNPGAMLEWVRRDGDRTLTVVGNPKYGLPYGTDLIALYGLCTKGRELYKREKTKWDGTVRFSSTSEMLRYFGDPPTKYYYERRMKSLIRIWGSRVEIVDVMERRGKAERRRLDKADFLRSIVAWFQLEDRQMGMPFENVFSFTPEMVEWIRTAPAFEDHKIFHMKQAVGQLQLYLLLRDRCAQTDLKERDHSWIPIHGPNSLESQLGWVRQPEPREVRRLLKRWLNAIRTEKGPDGKPLWANCPGEIHQGKDGAWRLMVWYVPPLFVQ